MTTGRGPLLPTAAMIGARQLVAIRGEPAAAVGKLGRPSVQLIGVLLPVKLAGHRSRTTSVNPTITVGGGRRGHLIIRNQRSSRAFRPASVILMRATAFRPPVLTVSRCIVARPLRTRLANVSMSNPKVNKVASGYPRGPALASRASAWRWSALSIISPATALAAQRDRAR